MLTDHEINIINNYVLKHEGGNIFYDVYNRFREFFKGPRKGASPLVREFLLKKGNMNIVEINVCRFPIYRIINYFFNLLTFGQFNKALKENNYDKLFHLYLYMTFDNGESYKVEKNEIVQIYPAYAYEGDCVNVRMKHKIKVIDFFDNGIHMQLKDFWLYNGINNNCQVFIMSLLNGNHLGNKNIENFVLQDLVSIFSEMPEYASTLSRIITDFAGSIDVLRYGAKLPKLKRK